MHVFSRRGNTIRRVSGTLSLFPAAQGKGACIQAWLSRMLQGGRGVRAELGRNVVFSVGFLFVFVIHIFCTAIAFKLAFLSHHVPRSRQGGYMDS
jgi:hypothetical protein